MCQRVPERPGPIEFPSTFPIDLRGRSGQSQSPRRRRGLLTLRTPLTQLRRHAYLRSPPPRCREFRNAEVSVDLHSNDSPCQDRGLPEATRTVAGLSANRTFRRFTFNLLICRWNCDYPYSCARSNSRRMARIPGKRVNIQNKYVSDRNELFVIR